MRKSVIVIGVIALVVILGLIFLFIGSSETTELASDDVSDSEVTNNPSEVETEPGVQDDINERPEVDIEDETVSEIFDLNAVISECNSLCGSNEEAYCSLERTIEVNGDEITGTCRAFARKGNVDGFSRCTGFCSDVSKSTAQLT